MANRHSILAAAIAIAALASPLPVPAGESDSSPAPETRTSEPPAAEASASTTETLKVGAPVTIKKALPLARLQKKAARYEGKTVRLEGVVGDVCQGRGCWIEVAGSGGLTFLAKSLDESVLVPKDSKGRKVVVQGVITRLPSAPHQHTEHLAEEGHVCPAPTWVLATQGVELHARP